MLCCFELVTSPHPSFNPGRTDIINTTTCVQLRNSIRLHICLTNCINYNIDYISKEGLNREEQRERERERERKRKGKRERECTSPAVYLQFIDQRAGQTLYQ